MAPPTGGLRRRRSSCTVDISNVTGVNEATYDAPDAAQSAERGELRPSSDNLAIEKLRGLNKAPTKRNLITKTLGSNIRQDVTFGVFLKYLASRVAGLTLTIGALGVGAWAFAHFGLRVEAFTVIYMTMTMVLFLAVLMSYYDCCDHQFKQKTSTIMFVLYIVTFNIFFFYFFDGPQHFQFGERLRDILVYEEFDRTDTNVIKSLYNVREEYEFWQWLDGPCISRSGFFKDKDETEEDSSSSSSSAQTGEQKSNSSSGDGGDSGGSGGWEGADPEMPMGMFDGGNYRLVGPVRLRQVRVVGSTCPDYRQAMATKMGMSCIGHMSNVRWKASSEWVSQEAYGPAGAAAKDGKGNDAAAAAAPDSSSSSGEREGFTYENEDYEMWWPPEEETRQKATSTVMWSVISSVFVPAGGFTTTLPYNATVEQAQAQVRGLKDRGWIDSHTGAVFVELTVVDAHVNLFAFVRIMFEFVDAGGIRPQIQMYIWQPTRNIDRILLGLWMTFVLFYTNEAVGNMFEQGKKYCTSWWNVFDWVGILTGVFAMTMAGAMYLSSPVNSYGDVTPPDNWLKGDQKFLNFALTARCANFFHWAVGINAFLTLIKVTKYAKQYWIRIWLVNRTITKAGKDIVAFMVIFCIIVIACAQAFTMLFAKDIYQLRSIGVSIGTLIDSMFGNLPLVALYNSDLPGTVFMSFFVMFAIFVLLTTLVAIMTDAYEQAHLHIMQLEANIREGKKGKRPLFDKKLTGSAAVLNVVFDETAGSTEPPRIMYKNKVYVVQWMTEPPLVKNKDIPLGFKKIDSTVNGTVTLTDDSKLHNPPKKVVKPSLKAVATNIINSQVEKLGVGGGRSRSGTATNPFAGVLRLSEASKEADMRTEADLKHYSELVNVYGEMVKLNEEQEGLTEQVERLRHLDLAAKAFDAYQRAERIRVFSEEVKAARMAQ